MRAQNFLRVGLFQSFFSVFVGVLLRFRDVCAVTCVLVPEDLQLSFRSPLGLFVRSHYMCVGVALHVCWCLSACVLVSFMTCVLVSNYMCVGVSGLAAVAA